MSVESIDNKIQTGDDTGKTESVGDNKKIKTESIGDNKKIKTESIGDSNKEQFPEWMILTQQLYMKWTLQREAAESQATNYQNEEKEDLSSFMRRNAKKLYDENNGKRKKYEDYNEDKYYENRKNKRKHYENLIYNDYLGEDDEEDFIAEEQFEEGKSEFKLR